MSNAASILYGGQPAAQPAEQQQPAERSIADRIYSPQSQPAQSQPEQSVADRLYGETPHSAFRHLAADLREQGLHLDDTQSDRTAQALNAEFTNARLTIEPAALLSAIKQPALDDRAAARANHDVAQQAKAAGFSVADLQQAGHWLGKTAPTLHAAIHSGGAANNAEVIVEVARAWRRSKA